jgi:septal ring factor EnvC (AmiA/AmiB activator)
MRVIAAIFLLLSAMPHGAHSQTKNQELQTTLRTLDASKKKSERLQKELQKAEETLEALREKATSNARSVQRAERSASKADAQLNKTRRALQQAQTTYDAQRDQYAEALRQLLYLRRLPPTAFFGDQAHVASMVRTAGVLRLAERRLAERATTMKQTIARLTELKDRLVAARNQSAARREHLAQSQQALARDLAERQKLFASLHQDHEKTKARMQALAKQSQDLSELIGKLNARKTTTPTIRTRKGSWKLPVAGNVLHRYGERKDRNERYRGIVVGARSAATVIAPSAGKVVFTGPFRDYGNMVLLRHDDAHISLLAGLGTLDVALDQSVAAGEPVGRMGNSSQPKLYMELRKSGKTIDPGVWYAKLGSRRSSNE